VNQVGEQDGELLPLAAGLGAHAAGDQAADELSRDELGEIGEASGHADQGRRQAVDLGQSRRPVRHGLELETLDVAEIAGDAGDRVGEKAAGAHGDQDAGGEGEQGEADREPADGAVDLCQELGFRDDDGELPALEAGAADSQPHLLLDVETVGRPGGDPGGGGLGGTGQLRREVRAVGDRRDHDLAVG
jgi:hypothetical protein